MVAAAAGDIAASRGFYTARTQAMTVVSYHVIGNDGIDSDVLVRDLLELGRSSSFVYVNPSEEFRAWLAAAEDGARIASGVPSSEPATRVIPLGIWFREDPERLVEATIEATRIETLDASSIVVAAAVSGAIAACSHVMSGWDLLLAAQETATRAIQALRPERYRVAAFDRTAQVVDALGSSRSLVGKSYAEVAGLEINPSLVPAVAAIVMAAGTTGDPVMVIDDAARNGGVDAGVLTAAMVGARAGLRRWPWRVPNETWYAEIGRRLVIHERELRDLPIPFAVEERIRSGRPSDPAAEID